MKVLQVCNKPPYPARDGGSIAMNNITTGLLKAGHTVKVLAMSTPRQLLIPSDIPADYTANTGFESVFVDTSIRSYDAFINLFSKKSYNIERFISKDFDEKMIQVLSGETFDIVQLESVYTAPYISTIRKHSKAKIVLRAHNIEHTIWERLAAGCGNFLKRYYIKHLASKLKNFERSVICDVDGIAAITDVDAAYLLAMGCEKPIISIPVGIEQSKIPVTEIQRQFPGIFHLGSMDWMPNQEAVKWFIENVWNQVSTEFPDVNLYLAGRNMPEWLLNTKMNGLIVQGEVKDAYQYMQSRTLMIVPLLSGSGMRVKIIEGMACGNTIISTSVGAEGIELTDGHDILIANTPAEFLMQIKKCIDNPELAINIGRQAKITVAEKYDNDVITANLVKFYKEIEI